jgi:hypothetical protein
MNLEASAPNRFHAGAKAQRIGHDYRGPKGPLFHRCDWTVNGR